MTTLGWLRADWPVPPGVVAGTTCRQGGVSIGRYASLNLGAHVGDDPEAVRTNRGRFRQVCGLPAEPEWLNQVHGTRVARAESGVRTAADAIVSGQADVVCAVLTADCLPVVFASTAGDEIGVAHAGWRGLLNGVLEATVGTFRTPPGRLLAWLGPAISQAAFEVGEEVREAFIGEDAEAGRHFRENERGRWQADLYGLARQRLERSGLSSIHGGRHCTFGEPGSFFSWRRDGRCGRMATFVYRSSI